MPAQLRTFFIAHAGADIDRAHKLRDLLHPGVSTFLDAADLSPGSDWNLELPKAQRSARATVALLSNKTDAAYYLREEIADAIAYHRVEPGHHRLIPVYLDGYPSDPGLVPYGLRSLHSLDARRLGLDGVANELRRVATVLEGVGAPMPAPAPPPRAVDRVRLYNVLCHLLDGQFEEVLFRVSAPLHDLAPALAARTMRARDLVQWAEGQGDGKYAELVANVRSLAPALLS
jgi:hypothetical protein